MNKLSIGDQAPDFTVAVGENETITLSELKGKYVIIYFYPKDDTPGCTLEAKDFNLLKNEFESLNVEIIGISKDSLASHAKFCSKYGLAFHLGADLDGAICEKYGTWVEKSMFGKKYMGINRATFLIDMNRNIAFIWPNVSAKNHANDVLLKLKELKK